MSRRVLVAFDKFKEAISAERACAIASREIRRRHSDWKVMTAPLTDGGEGFCRILTHAAGGEVLRVPVSGPRLEAMSAEMGFVSAHRLPEPVRRLLGVMEEHGALRIAVIEMAAASGLALVPPTARSPWRTTSFGTGQLMRTAAEMGAELILLGVGGSATSDLGLGALAALGLEFRDESGAKVKPPFPETWSRLAAIDGEIFPALPPVAIACDVANPLLGEQGAAAIFGPQKGLRPEEIGPFDASARRMAHLLCELCGRAFEAAVSEPGAGAAGGISFGLRTAARATLVPGFELVAGWLELERRLAAADVVVTGEGRFDQTSLGGKGPGAVVQLARQAGKRSVVFAGSVASELAGEGIVPITPLETPLAQALAETEQNLAAAVAAWAEAQP